jgi:predicted transcriptional regulator
MPGRRSKFEIYVDILSKIKSGVCKPTRIMYSANLSWQPLCQILESLEYQDMIEPMDLDGKDKRSRTLYRITEKGDNVLRYFDKAKSLLEVEVAPFL